MPKRKAPPQHQSPSKRVKTEPQPGVALGVIKVQQCLPSGPESDSEDELDSLSRSGRKQKKDSDADMPSPLSPVRTTTTTKRVASRSPAKKEAVVSRPTSTPTRRPMSRDVETRTLRSGSKPLPPPKRTPTKKTPARFTSVSPTITVEPSPAPSPAKRGRRGGQSPLKKEVKRQTTPLSEPEREEEDLENSPKKRGRVSKSPLKATKARKTAPAAESEDDTPQHTPTTKRGRVPVKLAAPQPRDLSPLTPSDEEEEVEKLVKPQSPRKRGRIATVSDKSPRKKLVTAREPPSASEEDEAPPVKASPKKRAVARKSGPAPKQPPPLSDVEETPPPMDDEPVVATPEALPIPEPMHTPEPEPERAAPNLATCLNAQKREILRALQRPYELAKLDDASATSVAVKQLTDLFSGTVTRGEGNSCLILGPRGSGKTSVVERCIAHLEEKPIVIRLCGWTETTDKLAMREIAYQLGHQTGKSFLADDEAANEETIEHPDPTALAQAPATHLPALISVLPTLSRPTVVVLDAFDLFAQHPRQALLYCLLDTVQSGRAGTQTKGLAVIGLTTRVDTLNLLEKRVKSRFSGRMFRTTPPQESSEWLELATRLLSRKITANDGGDWHGRWQAGIQTFFKDPKAIAALKETFSVSKDVRVLVRLLTSLVVHLSPASPFPTLNQLQTAIARQRSRPSFPMLHALPYPALCLLIATVHSDACGHPTFTFEMLYERVRDQIRVSQSAPVQFQGSSIGMPQCPRSVLLSAFEDLVSAKVIAIVATTSTALAKEFVKYRAVATKEDVKVALQTKGDVNLTKWLTKATVA
ncbi:AAA domain-containing protein [Mycena kentingensis (nom. inval.)]|nr:AAA domain-containing protein [Mycena kentingensis (nom. inval.)]